MYLNECVSCEVIVLIPLILVLHPFNARAKATDDWGLSCLIHRFCWSFLIRHLHLRARNTQCFVHKNFVMHTFCNNVSSIPNYIAFRSQRRDHPYHFLIFLPWCTLQHLVCATRGREKLDQVYCAWLSKGLLCLYILKKSGDLVGFYQCLTHRQTTEYSATQLVYSIQFKLSHAISGGDFLQIWCESKKDKN